MRTTNSIFSFFGGKNQHKEHKPILINPKKVLEKQNQDIKNWIEENVQNIAQNLLWNTNETFTLNLFPPVAYIRESYQALANDIGALYGKNMEIFRTQFNKYADAYEQNIINEKAAPKEVLDLESEQQEVLNEATTCHDGDIDVKKARKKELKEDIKNNRQDLKRFKKWNLTSYWIKFSIAVAIIATGEMLINSDTFLYLGFNKMKSTLIGLGISGVIFMIGFAQAAAFRSTTMKLWAKIGVSIGYSITVLSLFLVLGYVRTSLMNSQGENEGIFEMSPEMFMGLSIGFYVAIAACKAYFYPPKSKLTDNENYKAKETELKANLKEESGLQKEIANGYVSRNKKRQAVKKDFGKAINPLKAGIKTENNIIRQSVVGYNEEKTLADNFYKQVNSSYKFSVALLVNSINIRKKTDAPGLQMTVLDNLENPFANCETLLGSPTNIVKSDGGNDDNTHLSPEKMAWEVMAQNQNGETTTSYAFINPENNKS